MKQKPKVGDVFLIPVDESRRGIGQVVGDWKGELYVVIFRSVHNSEDVDPESIASEVPLLAALSLDAKIYNGDWKVIGNFRGNIERIPQPTYKVNQDGKVFLESRDRTISRPASPSESEALRFRTVVAPVRLERALKAICGIGEWNEKFDELRADYAFASSRFIDG